jgi:two-component system nitrate/nitrite sensor histidine kinase NarX
MAVPLAFQDENPLGAVLVASNKVKAFTPRQLSMLQTISSQVALVVHNISLMTELEYNSILAERARLAREIHDGLAQTLAYLKLKMAQLKNYAEQGDQERLLETLTSIYDTLAEAYGEVRGTIDGLRIVPDEQGLEGLLRQIAADFQEHSNLKIEFNDPLDNVPLPPEVQLQLVRIVQEALNNIHKHAGSAWVLISCQEVNGDLILEVRDDGKGFDLDDIPGSSQHGLRGMRERAELVGADFQVSSQPLQGTLIRLRLPLEYVGDTL